MRVVAFDLGSRCGWAMSDRRGGVVSAGETRLSPGKFEGAGMLFVRFRTLLSDLLGVPYLVMYEAVTFGQGPEARVIQGLQAILQEYCEHQRIPYAGVNVGTLKKHYTGKGNAKKDLMRAALRRRILRGEIVTTPVLPQLTDNAVDAIAILDYARTYHVPDEEVA